MIPFKNRHLVGGAAAACAVCCAAPIVGFLGIAGVAATAFTLAFAGVAFAAVVALISIAAVLIRRRRAPSVGSCSPVAAADLATDPSDAACCDGCSPVAAGPATAGS